MGNVEPLAVDANSVILPGYIIHEKVKESDRSIIYRGSSVRDNTPVIIKLLRPETTTMNNIAGLIREYNITRSISLKGAVMPIELVKAGGSLALIMKDNGAVFLSDYIHHNVVSISLFLDIGIKLADILGELHQQEIIHRGIKPDNILFNPDTGKVQIIDFSRAIFIRDRGSKNQAVDALPEAYGYMPPELLGLSQDVADYSSDYYSLGVVFYEMLSGSLPLQASNYAEWLQVHVNKKPERLDKLNPSVPPALSDIVMKLLSKAAYERYQTAYGIIKDLERCKMQWDAFGSIERFELGQMDLFPCLELPRKVIGREAEAGMLIKAYKRICEGKGGLVLVSGYAGTGKTMLVNEILKPISMERGYFAYGKFDQIRQSIPYAPFAKAFGTIIRQIMTENKEKLEDWRKKIQNTLGNNGSVMSKVIPELEQIIGQQPPAETLRPKEAQNRFLMVFENFISAFATKDTPLVIFLDDLQWADTASLELLKHVCKSADMGHLLIIGAYRDNEVGDDHELKAALREILEDDVPVWQIHLHPLGKKDAVKFVAEALHCPEEEVISLAGILYRKTLGNPFYLGQMMKTIYDERLIKFNVHKGGWEWKAEAAESLKVPDDVLDLLLIKLQKLSGETLAVLKLASCLGTVFSLETISAIYGKSQAEVSLLLEPAIIQGLVHKSSQWNGCIHETIDNKPGTIYEFVHDRIAQSVYSLFSQEEKKQAHVNIGYQLLKNTEKDSFEDGILTIMDHLNRGLDLIVDPMEKIRLGEYNLLAGRKAKASAAFDTAIRYFEVGIKLLGDNAWDDNYGLCYDLHMEYAQCKYMIGDINEAEKLFDISINRAKTEFEKADLYCMKMNLYSETGKYAEAVRIGIDVLKKYGMNLSIEPGLLDYAKELLAYKWLMLGKKTGDLVKLPEMKQPVQIKIAEFLINLILAACTDYPDLYSLAIIKAGNHAVRYGNTEMASIGYLGYSIVEGSVLGNYKAGYELGNVAIHLAEKYNKSHPKGIVYFTVGAIILHWTHHAKEGLDYLKKAIDFAIEAGDVLIEGYSYGVILENKYLLGLPLENILEEAEKCSNFAKRMKHKNLGLNAAVYKRLAAALLNGANDFSVPQAEGLDDEELMENLSGDKASLVAYYFSNIQLYYLTGNFNNALLEIKKVKEYAGAIMGFLLSAEINFYHSLAITGIYGELAAKDKKRYLRVLKKNQRQMKKWADSCAANFLHKYLLIEAEISRVLGKKREAEIMYDKAIQSAGENGYIQNQAIACELAARFYGDEGRTKVAKVYMGEAFNLYMKWGATAKVQDLKRRSPGLLDGLTLRDGMTNYVSEEILNHAVMKSDADRYKKTGSLDIQNMRKIIKNIYQQSEAEKLAKTFLVSVMENICANIGFLVIEKNGELFIEAEKDSRVGTEVIVKSTPLDQCDRIPRSIVQYVANTFEPVVINNGQQAGIFEKDPYIESSGAKSVACIPLRFWNIPVGVLYLENSFLEGVFTEERVELLKLLSNQTVFAKVIKKLLERDNSESMDEKCPAGTVSLTGREVEILKLISKGLSNSEIAEGLGVTNNTIKTHIKNIYGKLQVNRRVQAVARAKELNIQ